MCAPASSPWTQRSREDDPSWVMDPDADRDAESTTRAWMLEAIPVEGTVSALSIEG